MATKMPKKCANGSTRGLWMSNSILHALVLGFVFALGNAVFPVLGVSPLIVASTGFSPDSPTTDTSEELLSATSGPYSATISFTVDVKTLGIGYLNENFTQIVQLIIDNIVADTPSTGSQFASLKSTILPTSSVVQLSTTQYKVTFVKAPTYDIDTTEAVTIRVPHGVVGGSCGHWVVVQRFIFHPTALRLSGTLDSPTIPIYEDTLRRYGATLKYVLTWGSFKATVPDLSTYITSNISSSVVGSWGSTAGKLTVTQTRVDSYTVLLTFAPNANYDVQNPELLTIAFPTAATNGPAAGARGPTSQTLLIKDTQVRVRVHVNGDLTSAGTTTLSEWDVRTFVTPGVKFTLDVAARWAGGTFDYTVHAPMLLSAMVITSSGVTQAKGMAALKSNLFENWDVSYSQTSVDSFRLIVKMYEDHTYDIWNEERIQFVLPAAFLGATYPVLPLNKIGVLAEVADAVNSTWKEYGLSVAPAYNTSNLACSSFVFSEAILQRYRKTTLHSSFSADVGQCYYPKSYFTYSYHTTTGSGFALSYAGYNQNRASNNAMSKLIITSNATTDQQPKGWAYVVSQTLGTWQGGQLRAGSILGEANLNQMLGLESLYLGLPMTTSPYQSPYDITEDEKLILSVDAGAFEQAATCAGRCPAATKTPTDSGVSTVYPRTGVFPGYFTVKATRVHLSPTEVSALDVLKGLTLTFTIESVGGTEDKFFLSSKVLANSTIYGSTYNAYTGFTSGIGGNSTIFNNAAYPGLGHLFSTSKSFTSTTGSTLVVKTCDFFSGASVCSGASNTISLTYDYFPLTDETVSFTIPAEWFEASSGPVQVVEKLTIHPFTITPGGTFLEGSTRPINEIWKGGKTMTFTLAGYGNPTWLTPTPAQIAQWRYTISVHPASTGAAGGTFTWGTGNTAVLNKILCDTCFSLNTDKTILIITLAPAPNYVGAGEYIRVGVPKTALGVTTLNSSVAATSSLWDLGMFRVMRGSVDLTMSYPGQSAISCNTVDGCVIPYTYFRTKAITFTLSVESLATTTVDGGSAFRAGVAFTTQMRSALRQGFNNSGRGGGSSRGWNAVRSIMLPDSAIVVQPTQNIPSAPTGLSTKFLAFTTVPMAAYANGTQSFDPSWNERIDIYLPCTALTSFAYACLPDLNCPIPLGYISLTGINGINYACDFAQTLTVGPETRDVYSCTWWSSSSNTSVTYKRSCLHGSAACSKFVTGT